MPVCDGGSDGVVSETWRKGSCVRVKVQVNKQKGEPMIHKRTVRDSKSIALANTDPMNLNSI